jgi:hypothetical protein
MLPFSGVYWSLFAFRFVSTRLIKEETNFDSVEDEIDDRLGQSSSVGDDVARVAGLHVAMDF